MGRRFRAGHHDEAMPTHRRGGSRPSWAVRPSERPSAKVDGTPAWRFVDAGAWEHSSGLPT